MGIVYMCIFTYTTLFFPNKLYKNKGMKRGKKRKKKEAKWQRGV